MIINFDRIGQGGGSGSGSTVSWRQDLSAGTQIAQITINGTSQAVYAPEGGQGAGDYQVVSALPASAETGQLFYVPEHSGTTTLSGWEIFDEAENDFVGNITDDEEIMIELNTGEGGDFRLNDEWIGTSNTFREMRGINDQLDVVAKCDGQGHCWIYVITPGNFYFENMSMEETTTVEDSTYDYPGEIVPAATYRYLDGQFVLETLPVASQNTLGAVKIGSGITVDSGGTISVEGGQGGGIQKVSELPASAETGDVVWLNGKTYTGYTILCDTAARPGYVYELDRSNVAIDGNETSMRLGDFITGAWVSWEGVMVRPRVQETTDCPLLDVIDSGGTHTIAVGENAISMETGVTFPMKGCLYEYRADGWFRKARFEHIYEGAADGLALIQKIQYGIEEFGLEDFVLRFSPDKNGEREFVPYISTNYGIDFQATDSRNRDQEWGRISCRNYRLSASDGSFQDMVGNHWIVSEDQINIPRIESVYINSAGTITEHYGLELLSSMFNVSNRVCFHCNLEVDQKFSSAPLKWWYRQNEQVDGDTKLVYYACAEIPINGTVYRGIWKWPEWEYPDPFVPQSWTVVQ